MPEGYRWCPQCNGTEDLVTMNADPDMSETVRACDFPGCEEGRGIVPQEDSGNG